MLYCACLHILSLNKKEKNYTYTASPLFAEQPKTEEPADNNKTEQPKAAESAENAENNDIKIKK